MRPRVFLAGAGVSANPPTDFPVARTIIDALLGAIAPDPATCEELRTLADAARADRRHAADYLRFESLIETIKEMVDEDLHVLDFVDRFRTPNALHALLAERAIAGDAVLTPNFDGLIEQSILAAGASPVSIATDDDFREWLDAPRADAVPVYKLHGSYEQYDGATHVRTAATMQATIESLTADRRELLLSEPKRALLERHAAHELIVIGYSGSDDFDIVPTLATIGFARCTWIQHDASPVATDITDTALADIQARPEDEWSARERFFRQQASLGAGRLRILSVHTGVWLLALYGRSWTDVPRTPHPLEDYWHDWSSRFAGSPTLRCLISGELFAGLSRYLRAKELFEAAAAEDSPERDLAEVQLARMLIRRAEPGDFAAAEAAARRAVALVSAGTPFAQARAWHELGYIRYKRGQYADALSWLDKVLALPPDREILPYVMSSTHDKGVVLQDLGRHAEALPLLQRGLDLSWELGNFTHVAWSLHHIGLHHFYLGELAEARAAFVEARRTGSAIGDLNYVATVDHELALLDFLGGDVQRSIATLETALATGATTGSREFDGTDLQHLGIAYMELGDLDRAGALFVQAEEAYAAVENVEDAAELLCYRADLELQRHACADADAALARADAHQSQTPDYRMRIGFMHALADAVCREADAGPLMRVIEQAAAESRRYLLLDLVDLAARFRCGDRTREPFRTICASIAATYARAGNARRAARIEDFLSPHPR